MKRILGAWLALTLLLLLTPQASTQAAPSIAAGSAYLAEATTGRVLFAQDEDVRLPMASTTKVMTALLCIESGRLDETVAVPDAAVGTEGSSMYLEYGEQIRLVDLLYGLMLTSGNDAAVAIVITLDGSVEAFAEHMNVRAAELGLHNTNYCNPNGLHDPSHYTTARDLGVLACFAMQNDTFQKVVGTTYYETTSGAHVRTIKNKNRLLWQYDGGNGVKTGYTMAAGKCLVFAAKRDGMQLCGVVLNCGDMWNAAKSLLDFGFAQYEMQEQIDVGEVFFLPVAGGVKKELAASPKEGILIPIRKDGTDTVTVRATLFDVVLAPVAAGQTVGEMVVTVNDAKYAVPIVATDTVARVDFQFYLNAVLTLFLQ